MYILDFIECADRLPLRWEYAAAVRFSQSEYDAVLSDGTSGKLVQDAASMPENERHGDVPSSKQNDCDETNVASRSKKS
jgi:hypothetical protein